MHTVGRTIALSSEPALLRFVGHAAAHSADFVPRTLSVAVAVHAVAKHTLVARFAKLGNRTEHVAVASLAVNDLGARRVASKWHKVLKR